MRKSALCTDGKYEDVVLKREFIEEYFAVDSVVRLEDVYKNAIPDVMPWESLIAEME
jgi:hypothetical protein